MKNKIEIGDLVRFNGRYDIGGLGVDPAAYVTGVVLHVASWTAKILAHNGVTCFRDVGGCQLLAKGKQ